MIAKRIPTPKKTSSIKRLINYIAGPGKQRGVQPEQQSGIQGLSNYMDKPQAVVRISNCCFDTMPEAIKEIQATQKKNTRSKNEKTYHLVISFREGEQPDQEILAKIENKIADRIGFGEHQRISALHTDTNNWHLHVAINKVHPDTFRNVEPFYDKFKMSEACRELEKEFGLLPDNGIQPNRKKPMNPAQDKEAHTGTKSLISWIRENAAQGIIKVLAKDDLTWPELHKTLNRFGLTIRPRGAGFVVQDLGSGLTVKASNVDRGFSKKKIEGKLGAYQEAQVIHTSKDQYQEGPVQPATNERNSLWEQYQTERDKNRSARGDHLKLINDQRRTDLREIFADIRNRKQEARSSVILRWQQKKRIYAALQVERLQAMEKVNLLYGRKRDLVDARCPGLTWTTFLQNEAENGNEIAIKMLRQGKGKSIHDQADYISCTGKQQSIYQGMKYQVDKRGRIRYQLHDGWVLDAGKRVQPGSTDHNVLVASLQIAIGKYGKKLEVKGSRDFVERVIRAAKDKRLNVSINGQQITVNRGRQRGEGVGR
ncbi:MAG: relaxase/mobilization nuclease domain-containing protein [Desulfobulbaceae bacterium]|nr:relaxase/mobilization nuclease domain-containing protein [Desulfobulbaceae bacterium]